MKSVKRLIRLWKQSSNFSKSVGPVLHADSADISSTDILDRGVSPAFETTGSGGSVLRQCGIFFILFIACSLQVFARQQGYPSFASPQMEAVKKLKLRVGYPVQKGLVFVNGKYIEPPYKVERYGTVIRINSVQVTNPIVPWEQFLKTQSGYRIETSQGDYKIETVEEDVPVEIEEEVEVEVANAQLDSLFEDDVPQNADNSETRKVKRKIKRVVMQKKCVEKKVLVEGSRKKVVKYDGEFQFNYKVNGFLSKIDKERELIEKRLRSGWLLCFGSSYKRVEGDSVATRQVLDVLWRVQRDNNNLEAFVSAAQNETLGFLPRKVLIDFFKNRFDYVKLKKRSSY